MRKRKYHFYGQIKRLKPSRRTTQIHEIYEILNKAKTETVKCISGIKEDLDVAGRQRQEQTLQLETLGISYSSFIEYFVLGKTQETRNSSCLLKKGMSPFRENEEDVGAKRSKPF